MQEILIIVSYFPLLAVSPVQSLSPAGSGMVFLLASFLVSICDISNTLIVICGVFKPGSNCPKNRNNLGFLRFSDVWDSYDQWEHCIPDIPDGRRLLRRDRKNRKHLYFDGLSHTVPDVGDFYDECEHEIYLSGTSGMLHYVFSCYQNLISSE